MILLWGLPHERPLAAVRQALDRAGAAALVIDQRVTRATEVELCVGSGVHGCVRAPGVEVDLTAVTAVYARPYDVVRLSPPENRPDAPELRHAREVDAALWSWLDLTPARVVNCPSAMASNGSKPYQLQLIRREGFAVPETLVTTDPDAALEFWRRHGEVIYKSVSAVRSIVARLGDASVDRLGEVAGCPTQFQRYVPGRDYRVHVVGQEVFTSEVSSEADDYRYPGKHSVEIRASQIPPDVAERCLRLAESLCLPVAGVDLRRSPAGEWYCFEVNPSPAFTYYEDATRQPIAEAIARLLAEA